MFLTMIQCINATYPFALSISLGVVVILLQLLIILHTKPRIDPLRDRKYEMKWMDVKELWRFARLLGGLFSERIYSRYPSSNGRHVRSKLFLTIVPLIQGMWLKSGITFTISYWAEVLRLVVQYLDPKAKSLFQTKLWIKTHKGKTGTIHSLRGLPIILPLKVKLFLNNVKVGIASGSLPRGQLIQVKLLLSLLSFFRACSPTYRKVS